MINKIYFYLYDSKYFYKFIDYISYIIRKFRTKNVSDDILKNIEGINEMNIDKNWFYEEKKLGISGVARLKNGDDFLEDIIENYLPFLDELILVDNNSNDTTKKICKKMVLKYPNKIKFFEYNYKVESTYKNCVKSNSIHSLAYYYNWCFSKSKYKYVMKIDDDNYMIKEKFKEIRKHILKNRPNNYSIFYGINLGKINNKLHVLKDSPYAGKFGDHGIYPVSPKTYYTQGEKWEIFISNLIYHRFGFGYFHLKNFKKMKGCINYDNKDIIEKVEKFKYDNIINYKHEYSTVKKYEKIILNISNKLGKRKYQ